MNEFTIPTGFFAYPSTPESISEIVHTAVEEVNRKKQVFIKTWEQCRVGGKVIIHELCREIAVANLFCADLTGMNANVMFELGYAIAKNKRIWLVLDTSQLDTKTHFEQLRILTTVGYAEYCNSEDLLSRFFKDTPYADLDDTIVKQVVAPSIASGTREILLYLKSKYDNEASIRISRSLQQCPIPLITDDPNEAAVQSLAWYVQQIFSAIGVICHLTSPEREGARLPNARHALVAGMAFGLDKPLLMLAEGDFLAPIDYRDLLHHYLTGAQAKRHLDDWLPTPENLWHQNQAAQRDYVSTLRLATELKSLRFGDPIAENEADQLVNEYFIETNSYREALAGSSTIFIGRKGSGKTATLLKLESDFRRDRRDLVCVIKPVAYELQGVIELMKRFKQRDAKGYAVESLWKFLLYSELAKTAADEIQSRPSQMVEQAEEELIAYLDQQNLRDDFAVRLEHCVFQLLSTQVEAPTIEEGRAAISEALHQGVLGKLRVMLGRVLAGKNRVAILVDNLDKAWDKERDIAYLSEFFLGLLSAAARVPIDFRRDDTRRDAVKVTLAVFLRSDIFHKVMDVAREPDKIRFSRIEWDDKELLLRVLEERFAASHEVIRNPSELWGKYFCPKIKALLPQDYFTKQVLPRPRDILFFVNAAVNVAVNRGHVIVEENDIFEAEKQYSQYALESILVENGVGVSSLESIIYEFVGCNAQLSVDEISDSLIRVQVPKEKIAGVIDHLCGLTFLGVEVGPEDFRFAEDPQEYRKNLVLARKLAEKRGGGMRYMINRPFWAFLEIAEA